MGLYLTTAVNSDNFFENLSNVCFQPIRNLFHGRTFTFYKGLFIEEKQSDSSPLRKIFRIALSILLLIPGTILGICFKASLLLFSNPARKRFAACLKALGQEEPFFRKDPHYLNNKLDVLEKAYLAPKEPDNGDGSPPPKSCYKSGYLSDSDSTNLSDDDADEDPYEALNNTISLVVGEYIDKHPDKFNHLIATNPENISKNRFSVYPFDYVSPNPYVNASKVNFGELTLILMQGPKEDTISDTLQYLFKEDANTLITLTMDEEKGQKKCFPYWLGYNNGDPKNEISLILRGEEAVKDEGGKIIYHGKQSIIKRVLTLTIGKVSREIVQYHYQNWPDHGTPDRTCFDKFLKITGKDLDENPTTLAVHCSAGIGRSGFYAALQSYRLMKKASLKFKRELPSFAEHILDLRLQRNPQALQNEEQFKAAYAHVNSMG